MFDFDNSFCELLSSSGPKLTAVQIDTNKFDPTVLARYQASFTPHNEIARNVLDRVNPSIPDPSFDYQTVSRTQGIHQARFQQTLGEDKNRMDTDMTIAPREIIHHFEECLDDIKRFIPYSGQWEEWQGMNVTRAKKLIYGFPDTLFHRFGASILLANIHLDPAKEIQRYFDDWKMRYGKALEKLDAHRPYIANGKHSRIKYLGEYTKVVVEFATELICEITRLVKLIKPNMV
jgi:hypothetical protein